MSDQQTELAPDIESKVRLLTDLEKAKEYVIWLVENPSGLADMHDLVHWAGEVRRLRSELKDQL